MQVMASPTDRARVLLKDIAAEAGVSVATVSRVMNGRPGVNTETRDRIARMLEDREVAPRRQAAETGLQLIGFVNDSEQYSMESSYTAALISGVNRRCHAHNYNPVLVEATEINKEMRTPGSVTVLQHVHGLIWSTPVFTGSHARWVAERRMPCVVINNVQRGIPVSLVDSGNMAAARQAVEFLVGMGHTEIGFIGGDLNLVNFADRYAGYRSQMADLGLPVNDDWIVNDLSQNDRASALEGVIRLIGRGNLPSAIICASLPVARGVYEALRHRGIDIPNDISVLAYDDSEECELLNPPLTTFRQPLSAMASRAVDTLIEAVHDAAVPEGPVLLSERLSLIVRGSVSDRRTLEAAR